MEGLKCERRFMVTRAKEDYEQITPAQRPL